MQLLACRNRYSDTGSADNDDFAVLENSKPPSNGQTSPKRKTPKARQSPVSNGFVEVDPEEAAKQN